MVEYTASLEQNIQQILSQIQHYWYKDFTTIACFLFIFMV